MATRITVDDLLDELEELVDKATRVPLSRGRAVLDSNDVQDIIADIRDNLPQESRQARAIVADRNQILSDARREAETIIRVAEEKSRAMVNQNEITKRAQQKANDMLTETQKKCREMRKATNDYIEDLMKRTDEALAGQLSELRKTRQSIRASQKNAPK